MVKKNSTWHTFANWHWSFTCPTKLVTWAISSTENSATTNKRPAIDC